MSLDCLGLPCGMHGSFWVENYDFFFTKSTKLGIPVVINLTTLSVIFSISYCVYNI